MLAGYPGSAVRQQTRSKSQKLLKTNDSTPAAKSSGSVLVKYDSQTYHTSGRGSSRTPGASLPVRNASYEAYGFGNNGNSLAGSHNNRMHQRSSSHEAIPRRYEGGESVNIED